VTRRPTRLALAALLLAAVPASLLAASAPALAQATDPVRAQLEARILQLEEEVRKLTGRVEQLEYQQQQLVNRMDRLVGAVDERLRAVEPGQQTAQAGNEAGGARTSEAPTAPSAPLSPGPEARRPPPSQARAQAPAPDVDQDAAAAQGHVLGAIPRDLALNPPTPPPPPGAADVGYEGALRLLQASKWTEAQQAFQGFLDKSPKDPRAPNAAYWLGETYYVGKDYQNAAAVFARNYKTYGADSPKAPDNLLKMGMSLAMLGKKAEACQVFGELTKRHPNAPAPVKQTLARERAADGCTG
jgi:tol-pal system protein YbgF